MPRATTPRVGNIRAGNVPPPTPPPDAPGEAPATIQPDIAAILLNQRVIRELGQVAPAFDRAGLLSEIFTEWGKLKRTNGQSALAAAIVEEFLACKPGSVPRQRILDMVCRLINWHSDDVHAKPVEEMTEEELVHAIHGALPRLEDLVRNPEPCEPEV